MLEVEPDSGPPPGPQAGMSIAEAARRTGVSAHTLRYYERAGLVVTPVDRTGSGRRRYQDEEPEVDFHMHEAAGHRHAYQGHPALRPARDPPAQVTSRNGLPSWKPTVPT